MEVHWSKVGEVYVTPVADGLVGVAVLTGRRATFPELLSAFPTLTARIEGNPITRVRGAGPLRQRSTHRVRGRVLLVGDAAGYVDALTGEGIAVGIAQARAAVAAIVAGEPGGYERAWRRVTRRHDLLTQGLLDRHPARRAAPPDRAGGGRAAAGVRRGRQPAREAGMTTPDEQRGEQVVLLDESGHAVGVADKATVHHRDTPLHLAFSCYVRSARRRGARHPSRDPQADVAGRLDQQRVRTSGARRARRRRPCGAAPCSELGIRLDDVRLVLPAFRYRAVMADGTVENEMCPVFVATTTDAVRADPDEVDVLRLGGLAGVPRLGAGRHPGGQPLVRRAAPGHAGGPVDRLRPVRRPASRRPHPRIVRDGSQVSGRPEPAQCHGLPVRR